MLRQNLHVAPLAKEDIPHVISLILAQNLRQETLDPRLHTHKSSEDLATMLQAQLAMGTDRPLVAHNDAGQVRGYVLPGLWEMEPDDEMISFFTTRNGIEQYWTLPAPSESDALPVADVLLSALTAYWKQKKTYGDVARWPSQDLWLEPTLLAHGFQVDSQMALRSLEPLPTAKHPSPIGFHARLARREDEAALVRLHYEELAFHVPYTPFVRLVAALESSLKERLSTLWSGQSVLDGAPLVVVIEHNAEIVAMAENALVVARDFGGFALLPGGRYGYLNNVCVSAKVRGQGVGRLLVEEVFTAFSPYKIDAYLLWYNQDNPLANGFWPHLGFRPLWKTYQRRNADDHVPTIA